MRRKTVCRECCFWMHADSEPSCVVASASTCCGKPMMETDAPVLFLELNRIGHETENALRIAVDRIYRMMNTNG